MPETLAILRCLDCGALDPGPRRLCAKCGSRRLEATPVRGEGSLVSWTVIRRPPQRFAEEPAYAVAVVDLEEGVRVTGRLDSFEPEPALGIPVRVSALANGVPVFAPR